MVGIAIEDEEVDVGVAADVDEDSDAEVDAYVQAGGGPFSEWWGIDNANAGRMENIVRSLIFEYLSIRICC